MNYRSFADLSQDVKANLHKIPRDVSLIVGIPRSGLLAANLIAHYLNLPLTDIDNFISGKVLCTSNRIQEYENNALKGQILIVDDSIATGKAIVDAKQKLKAIIDEGKLKLLFCCVYADPLKKNLVDIPLLLLNRPRVFEWNLFHNKIIEKSGLNLLGILAKNKSDVEKVENNQHSKFLLNAQPYILPKKKIATIMQIGEENDLQTAKTWLQQNNIEYDELIVQESLNIGLEYKKRKNLTLFLTSKESEAQQIFKISGKDVYCLESNTFYSNQKSQVVNASLLFRSKQFISMFKDKIKSFS